MSRTGRVSDPSPFKGGHTGSRFAKGQSAPRHTVCRFESKRISYCVRKKHLERNTALKKTVLVTVEQSRAPRLFSCIRELRGRAGPLLSPHRVYLRHVRLPHCSPDNTASPIQGAFNVSTSSQQCRSRHVTPVYPQTASVCLSVAILHKRTPQKIIGTYTDREIQGYLSRSRHVKFNPTLFACSLHARRKA